MATSSIVFVGNGFQRQLFDEHDLFPEPMARDYVAFGSMGQYAYGANTYRFTVVNDKVVLNHNSDIVLSDVLVDAGRKIAHALEAQSPAGLAVTGLGFNFETVLPQGDAGPMGAEFCSALYDAERIREALGSAFSEIQSSIVAQRAGVRCTMRVEPHIASGGANLFFSVNGHQDVGAVGQLRDRWSKAGSVREYIESVVASLSHKFQGGDQ